MRWKTTVIAPSGSKLPPKPETNKYCHDSTRTDKLSTYLTPSGPIQDGVTRLRSQFVYSQLSLFVLFGETLAGEVFLFFLHVLFSLQVRLIPWSVIVCSLETFMEESILNRRGRSNLRFLGYTRPLSASDQVHATILEGTKTCQIFTIYNTTIPLMFTLYFLWLPHPLLGT